MREVSAYMTPKDKVGEKNKFRDLTVVTETMASKSVEITKKTTKLLTNAESESQTSGKCAEKG